jgi:hypothetical protein
MTILLMALSLNILKPTGYVMQYQFNIQEFYILPTLCLGFMYLSQNKHRFKPCRYKRVSFYNGEEKCLLRGTKWVFK